jgi:hypothetical protein
MLATHSAYITKHYEAQDLQDAVTALTSKALHLTADHQAQVSLTLSTDPSHNINPKSHFPLQFRSLGATIYFKKADFQKTNISNTYTLTLDINFSDPYEF